MASPSSIMISVDDDRRSWRAWSDLPKELLRLVMEWLSGGDRIRFRAVCENWGLSTIRNDNIPKLPWIMYHSFLPDQRTRWSFFEPGPQLPHIIEDKGWWYSKWRRRSPFICDSRGGWVLLAERISPSHHFFDNDHNSDHRHYIYHPLYKKIISIPRPEFMQGPNSENCMFGKLAAFSSSSSSTPSSPPDCAFIVSIVNRGMNYFFISTYSVWDETWTTYSCHHHPYFYYIDNMAYMEGSVYCYNGKQGLSSFHIATEEWRLLSNQNTLIMLTDFDHMDFVAYDGHLHLVYLMKSVGMPLCNILRYDWSDGAWKKMQTLEGGAIFFGKPSFGIPASKQTKMVANRVYYFSSRGFSPKFLVYGTKEEDWEEDWEEEEEWEEDEDEDEEEEEDEEEDEDEDWVKEEEKSELSLPCHEIYCEIAMAHRVISKYIWMDPPPF